MDHLHKNFISHKKNSHWAKNFFGSLWLLLSMMFGGVCYADTDMRFYIHPEGEMLFLDKTFIKGGNEVVLGGGGNFIFGFRIDDIEIATMIGYHHFSFDGHFSENNQSHYFETSEGFIPTALGINYIFSIGDFAIVPGLARGLMLHMIDRTTTYRSGDEPLVVKETITQTRGLWLPQLQLVYVPDDDWQISLATKFYIVPDGYSDNYTKTAKKRSYDENYQTYNKEDELFWYGTITLGVSYIF
ncbi:MAG: hypothetical protein ACR2NY_04530 [Alphaproteobacteria bacterium]